MKNMNVLIVDDEQDCCFLLSGILKQHHISSKFVNSLSEAGPALETLHPEILILDNHLPDGYGLDYIHLVKQRHPDTKIVMITAHDSTAERQKAFDEGADVFIAKPVNKQLILDAINNFHLEAQH
jgi:two-component system, OmpR family, response regulator